MIDPQRSELVGPVLESVVHQAGRRMTRARRAVMECLRSSAVPLTHAQIVEQLHEEQIDPATVYRNLVTLTGLKLLTRHELGDHLWRYQVNQGPLDHPVITAHFSCLTCKTLLPLPFDAIEDLLLLALPGSATLDEIIVRGICACCEDAATTESGRA